MSAYIVGLNDELDEDQGKDESLDSLLAEPQAQPPALGDDVPEKYRGKSARELLDIVTNQESMIGRQGQELGDLRSTVGTLRGSVDAALALRNPGTAADGIGTEEDLTDRDFALDPVDATRRMVQRETRSLHEQQVQNAKQARANQFERQYANAASDVNDPKFVDFVKRSATRSRLATQAFSDMDNVNFDAAEQLWELYDDFKGMNASDGVVTDPDEPVAPVARPAPAKGKAAPSLVTGNSGGGDSNANTSGKPLYSQAALNDLAASDPDKYWSEAVQKPLNAAYAEGRVRQDI